MHVLVIGAGLSGLGSAWFLARRGHRVTVIDRAPDPGLETSFANGGLLTPSMSDPWNAPGCWRILLASLGRDDAALQLRARAIPGLIGWGARFLWHSAPSRHAKATAANLDLALASLEMLGEIAGEAQIDFAHCRPGSLRLFRDAGALARAATARDARLACHTLTPAEVARFEPGLASIADTLAGAIHYPADEVGNAHRFCVELTRALAGRGVEFLWEYDVTSLKQRGDRVAAACIGDQRIEADVFLVAAASHAPRLLRSVGVKVPIVPAKGYSLTIPFTDVPPISVPLVDDDLHAVVVPIGRMLRVAGTAEFAGHDTRIAAKRIDNLIALLRRLLPDGDLDLAKATAWCGLRAMSADGVPLVGPTRLANLHVNSGHGHLGWTMAAGAGRLAADLIDGSPPPIDPQPYDPARFGWPHV